MSFLTFLLGIGVGAFLWHPKSEKQREFILAYVDQVMGHYYRMKQNRK